MAKFPEVFHMISCLGQHCCFSVFVETDTVLTLCSRLVVLSLTRVFVLLHKSFVFLYKNSCVHMHQVFEFSFIGSFMVIPMSIAKQAFNARDNQ